MAVIQETLTLNDAFSANFTRYIQLGKQAAGASDLASAAARNYQSVANSLDRHLIALNAQFAVGAQKQQAMVAAGKQNTEAFSQLDAKLEKLGQTIRDTDAQYNMVTAQMERAQAAAKEAASATEQVTKSQTSAKTSTDALTRSLKSLLGAYLGIQGVKGILSLSDSLASSTARLNMMNDGLQTTAQLNDMIYQSAVRSRGAYTDTAAFVAKLGALAGNAFSSNAEIVTFAEQINKQMVLSGTSASEAAGAMLQLTQGLSSGVLQGEELKSVLEQTPMIAQTIAQYMGVTTGEMRELASQGAVTAEVVKNALLGAAEETNAAFEAMPYTWAQVWTQMQNISIQTFQPILDAVGTLADFIGNNLNTAIAVFYGLAAAVAFYAAAQWLATAAAQGFFTTLLTNPITYIAIAIGLVIGYIYQWVQAMGGLQAAWLTVVSEVLYFWDTLKMAFFQGVYWVMDLFDTLVLKFQSVGVSIQNFMGDMKVGVLEILQNMVNGAIGIINWFIDKINLIPGVNIAAVEKLTFATTESAANEAAKASREADLVAAQQEAEARAAERAETIADMWQQRDLDYAARQVEIEAAQASSATTMGTQMAGYTAYSDLSNQLSGIGESVASIDKEVSMSNEDLKSLVDMAERQYVANVNLTSQTPVINITGANTGNTDADRKAIADAKLKS